MRTMASSNPCRQATSGVLRARAVACAIVLLSIVLGASGCTHRGAPPVASHPLIGNGSDGEDWVIGGRAQRVWIRGEDPDAPWLLVLHGGPGASATGLFRHFVPALERHFVVAYWDQRGTGRSYHRDMRADEISLPRLVADTGEVIARLHARRAGYPLHLMGVSWGGLLAMERAATSISGIDSIVLVSPAVWPARAEHESWRWTLERARRSGDERATRALESMGPPPHSVSDMLSMRRWTERLGGAFAGDLDQGDLMLGALATPEMGWWDLVLFGAGNRLALNALWPTISTRQAPLQLAGPVPVLYVLGRHDWQVPAQVSERHAQALALPCKRVVWFERSGHHPAFEEPERFVQVLRRWAAEDAEPCPAVP